MSLNGASQRKGRIVFSSCGGDRKPEHAANRGTSCKGGFNSTALLNAPQESKHIGCGDLGDRTLLQRSGKNFIIHVFFETVGCALPSLTILAMYSSAIAPNVFALAALAAARSSLFWVDGSPPLARSAFAASRFARASDRLTAGYWPRASVFRFCMNL
jgi:hypothetical protein